jgi:hypothetical protein
MYVLVRLDLETTYRCVQGAHALAQFAFEHPEEFKAWNNTTIVFLGVRYPVGINEWILKLEGKKYSVFREPDQDMQPTAIACYDTGFVFRKLLIAS